MSALPVGQDLFGVLVLGDRQQGREVADVLLEEVEDRGDPALAEPHPWSHSLRLELLAAGVGGLLEEWDPRLGPQLLAEEHRRVGTDRQLDAGDRLRGVPVAREVVGRTLQVQLGAGAGSLGNDGVGGGPQPFGTGDVDDDVFTATVEDLVAEQAVARVRSERICREVLLAQRRQDPDHDHVRTNVTSPFLGMVEAVAQTQLVGLEPVLVEVPRGHIDLDVELPELRLEVGIGDLVEHLGALHRRHRFVVDEIELDLQADHRVVGVEHRLAEHPGEHVETLAHLLPVAHAVSTCELLGRDVFTHSGSVVACAAVRHPIRWAPLRCRGCRRRPAQPGDPGQWR